jgi:RNA polymerase sigma factor (sigma-70 family)
VRLAALIVYGLVSDQSEHGDNAVRPSFLDLLDRDRDEAFKQFYCFVMAAFRWRLPVPLRGLSEEDRQDFLHDTILHCVKDDFRVLRMYVPRGKSFAGWLYMVFTNRCRDLLRTAEMRVSKVPIHADEEGRSVESRLADPGGLPDAQVENAETVSLINKALEGIGQKCRLLLEMAADGLKPKQMARLLGLAEDQNKKVADDLRYCRERLRKLIRRMGLDLGEVLGPK